MEFGDIDNDKVIETELQNTLKSTASTLKTIKEIEKEMGLMRNSLSVKLNSWKEALINASKREEATLDEKDGNGDSLDYSNTTAPINSTKSEFLNGLCVNDDTIETNGTDEITAAHTHSSRGGRMDGLLVKDTTLETTPDTTVNGISVQKTKTSISNELIACVGSIDDWSFMAILDTGANANFISVIFAMKLKTMVDDERRPSITTSSDTAMESYGVIWNVKIKVYGHECIQNFVIVNSPHSVILGTPWLDRMSAKLCFSTDCDRKLMIGQKEHNLINYTTKLSVLSDESSQESENDETTHDYVLESYETNNVNEFTVDDSTTNSEFERDKENQQAGHSRISNNSNLNIATQTDESFGPSNEDMLTRFVINGGRQPRDFLEKMATYCKNSKRNGIMQFYYAEDQFVLRHMKEGGKYIEPDERDRAFLIKQIHERDCTVNSPLATLKTVKETFRWKGMAGDVMRMVTHCKMCDGVSEKPAHWRPYIAQEMEQ